MLQGTAVTGEPRLLCRKSLPSISVRPPLSLRSETPVPSKSRQNGLIVCHTDFKFHLKVKEKFKNIPGVFFKGGEGETAMGGDAPSNRHVAETCSH